MADQIDEKKDEIQPESRGTRDTSTSTEISTEMKRAYLNYAMSVIVSRALPDVRDGLKPVHRRILFAMNQLGLHSTAKFSKSVRIVARVLSDTHPHGDSAVYESMVRLAQDFSMRYPLVHGQGNFGSIDGDPAAAMRYTEAKLAKISDEMLVDLDKETVDWVDNFDGRIQEPTHLPAKLPNLLLMGAEGIAVGMATKIPPHNLTELCDAIIHMLGVAKIKEDQDSKSKSKTDEQVARDVLPRLTFDTELDDLLQYVTGPDFPTAGAIYGAAEIKQMYATGRGKILIRAIIEEEEIKGKTAIVVRELPYQVNKSNLVAKIAQLVIDKKIIGISDLRDESSREGIRVVIELKRDAQYKKVLNNLFKYTELQSSFPANIVALVDGIPQTLSLTTILEHFIKHRIDVVIRRSEYELEAAKRRAHILEGYLIALDHIDEVIATIKKSKDEPEAKVALMKKFGFSELQAQAILEMQLRRLTGLERDKIEDELKMLKETIDYLTGLLKDVFKILAVVGDEVDYLKKKYGDKRRTKVFKMRPGEITDEQLIENKEVIVVMTKEGYIKQIPRETFKVQHRGGKGVSGIETKDTDDVSSITTAMTHDWMLYFTNQGRVFKTRVWDIPQGSRISKGKAIVNLLTLRPSEIVTSILTYATDTEVAESNKFILMSTKRGVVKKTKFTDFANIKSSGIIAIKLPANDELLWVMLTDSTKNVMLISGSGKAIIFKEAEVRSMGRASQGVRGMKIDSSDYIASADVFEDRDLKKSILVIGQKGIGKKTTLSLFKDQHRGGKGMKIASVDDKMGHIALANIIEDEKSTLIITSVKGQVVKIPVSSIPSRSRAAKGVILMRFAHAGDRVVSATFV